MCKKNCSWASFFSMRGSKLSNNVFLITNFPYSNFIQFCVFLKKKLSLKRFYRLILGQKKAKRFVLWLLKHEYRLFF